jgi:putative ABC transport system permease protein
MRKVVLQGLWAHKLRLALTALAIVLGVTFISGTLVLTDTLHNTFTTLFGRVYQNVDFEIRGTAALSGGNDNTGAVRNPISAAIAPVVRHIPGVAYADGIASGYAQFVSPGGKAISNGGAPNLGLSYDPNPKLSALTLSAGSAPRGAHDVVMDAGTAQKYHFKVGDHVRVLLAGPPRTFTISGIVKFGTASNLAGATIAAFDLPTAQKLFDVVGRYDVIDVLASPGADKSTVQHDIAAALPKGVEVVTGKTVANEQSSDINNALSFFSTALLVFAFISLFVGGFTIFNTFSITVGQRTRELALLRIVGASRRQVFRSVLAEAFVVGAVASVIGLGLGVLAAAGLEALLKGFGITLPAGSLVFEGRTVIVGLLVGVGVTLISAISPARRAVRVPPVAALADYQADRQESSQRRIVIGSGFGLVGIALLVFGLTKPAIQFVGVGAVALFIGIGMLSPVVARPMASLIGRPLAARFGIAGKLGRENSMRSPRRTAQTASALLVGIALVSTIAVFGASLSKSVTSSVQNAINADYIVTSSAQGGAGQFSQSVSAAASRVPGVTAVSTVYQGAFDVRHSLSNLTAVSTNKLSRTVTLHMASGRGRAALVAGQLLIDTNAATAKHLSVGSVVPVRFARTGATTLRVGGIFQPNALLGSYVVGDDYFLAHFDTPLPVAVLLRTPATNGATSKAISTALHAYPNLKIQSKAAFEKSQEAQVNQLLGLVYALLALAVLIAVIGIVNTLMLSVFERTHEIGLLRAVGMKRRQIRAMIRSEAVILAVFGGVIGIVVGTALGASFAAALKQQGITDVVIPLGSLVVFLVLSVILGLGAASWPARRAAKLDVLRAIAAD